MFNSSDTIMNDLTNYINKAENSDLFDLIFEKAPRIEKPKDLYFSKEELDYFIDDVFLGVYMERIYMGSLRHNNRDDERKVFSFHEKIKHFEIQSIIFIDFPFIISRCIKEKSIQYKFSMNAIPYNCFIDPLAFESCVSLNKMVDVETLTVLPDLSEKLKGIINSVNRYFYRKG